MNIFYFSQNIWDGAKKNGTKAKNPNPLPRRTPNSPRESGGSIKKRGLIARRAVLGPRCQGHYQEARAQYQAPRILNQEESNQNQEPPPHTNM